MDFLLWHAIAMISVIAVSFSAGYYTALQVKRKKDEI